MAKLAITAISIALLYASGLAQAAEHSDLQAQVQKLEQDKKVLATRLNNAIAFSKSRAMQIDRQHDMADSEKSKREALNNRLSKAIAFSKERASQIEALQQQLDAEKSKSKIANNRLRKAIAFSKERAVQLEAGSKTQMAMSTGLTNAIAQSKKKAAQTSLLQQQLDSEKSKSKALSSRLRNAVAFSKERAAQLEAGSKTQMAMSTGLTNAIAQSKKKATQMSLLKQQLDSEKSKSMALSSRLRNAVAFSKERAVQLNSANSKSKALDSRLRNAIAYSKARANQLSHSGWAATVSANLNSAIGGVQGTTVITNSDNSVNVQVGNNGLFSTAGTVLSAGGRQLLSTIAQQLSGVDTNITVVGHTDSVPVGSSSRFSSNEELSFARAASTLQFLRGQGISYEQLSAAGYGAGSPIAGNDTAEGRAQNRRVDIILRQQ